MRIQDTPWLFLAPRSNETSRENFLATLASGYPVEEVESLLTEGEKLTLGNRKKLFIWGNSPGKAGSWKKMKIGDSVAFYAKGEFVYVGKCILKKHSPEIARKLWGNVPKKDFTWEYVFFLDELRPILIPLSVVKELGDYKEKMIVQGFVPIKEEAMERILSRYGSLLSFFDNYTPGLRAKDFSVLEEVAEEKELTPKNIVEIDEATRGKDLDLLLLEWEQRKAGESPDVVERKVSMIKRNVTMVRQLKEKYKNQCQVCGFSFKQRNGTYYSEVAHIDPISSKKAGVDAPSNMIVLCPNHHKMLDLGNLKIISNTEYSVDDKVQTLLVPLYRINQT